MKACPHPFPFHFHRTQAEVVDTSYYKWFNDRDQIIKTMTELGCDRKTIATQVNCETHTITNRRRAMGMT